MKWNYDDLSYQQVCLNAAVDDSFYYFKKLPGYTRVLEHVSIEQGYLFLDIIKRDNPQLMGLVDDFFLNNMCGAKVHNYDGFSLSPSTLRYVKVLSDLITLFGSLNNLKIAEIGIGYGGQMFIINTAFEPKDYTLIDIPVVCDLTKRYLSEIEKVFGGMTYRILTPGQIQPEDYDLVISNYAFSELDKDGMDYYLENVINKSTHGYLTCNINSSFGYSYEELYPLIKHDITVIQEEPLTGPTNKLIYW